MPSPSPCRELTYAARKINTDYFRVIEAWAAAGALYLVTCYVIAFPCASSSGGSNGRLTDA